MPRRPSGYYGMRRGALRVARGQPYSPRRGAPRNWNRGRGTPGGGVGGAGGCGLFLLVTIGFLGIPYFVTMYLTRKMEDQAERKAFAWGITIVFWIIVIVIWSYLSSRHQTPTDGWSY